MPYGGRRKPSTNSRGAVSLLRHFGHPQPSSGLLPENPGPNCADSVSGDGGCGADPEWRGGLGWESSLFVEQALEYGKRTYSGVARLGVEALELKIAGYSGTDIARLYGVQPNHVGAWISRAAQKLKKDLFLVENGGTNP